MAPNKTVPPYGRRAGLVPRRPEDFGDGGAFPEVHVAQYPLSMGLVRGDPETAAGSSSRNVLALTVDARGGVAFDAVVRQGENAARIVYTSHSDLVPKIASAPGQDFACEDEYEGEEAATTTARTRVALQAVVDARLCAAQPASFRPIRRRDDDPAFVRYRPARQLAAFSSGADERVVRMANAQEDPVVPPRHRRRRLLRTAGSPPVTVMHSPPRPVSRKDEDEWKIPACISNWKNPKGYCIPLDKRAAEVASVCRRMQDVRISDGFAGLSESLYVAEQKAREAIKMRNRVRKELMMKERQEREPELRALREIANRARAEAAASAAAPAPPQVDAERMQRDVVREERRRQREWERRREAWSGKKSNVTRDADRDVSERIALGMASTGGAAGACEVTYDERLFNQDTGMDSGFAAGDDRYNVYSGRLFAAQPALSTLYRPNRHGDSDTYGGDADEQIEKITRTERFKPDRGFSGTADRLAGKRERAVEFDMPEERAEDDDPFVELDQYMTNVKEGKKD